MWDNRWTLGALALIALLGLSAAAWSGFGMMATGHNGNWQYPAWAGNQSGDRTWAGNWPGPGNHTRAINMSNASMRKRFANGTFNATNMTVPAEQRLAFSQALYEGDYAGAQTLAGQYPALNRTLSHMNPSTFDSQAQFYRDMQSHDFSAALADMQQMRNSTHSAPMTGASGMMGGFGSFAGASGMAGSYGALRGHLGSGAFGTGSGMRGFAGARGTGRY